ncbi:MAG TPA: sorbosone dehydrogenase family protein, partial [Thermoanaerobaculia bacterium]
MKPAFAIALVLTSLACSRSDAQSAASKQTAPPKQSARSMPHFEVRADQLPKPYHTTSSGNPPQVIARPANATLNVPPGFRVELW